MEFQFESLIYIYKRRICLRERNWNRIMFSWIDIRKRLNIKYNYWSQRTNRGINVILIKNLYIGVIDYKERKNKGRKAFQFHDWNESSNGLYLLYHGGCNYIHHKLLIKIFSNQMIQLVMLKSVTLHLIWMINLF